MFCLLWFVFSNFNLCMVIQLVFPYLLLWNKKAIHVARVNPELNNRSSFNQSNMRIIIYSFTECPFFLTGIWPLLGLSLVLPFLKTGPFAI